MKKPAVAVLFLLVCFNYAMPQSLAELARMETARRAACRAEGKRSVIATNADLEKYREIDKYVDTFEKSGSNSSSTNKINAAPQSGINVSVREERDGLDQRARDYRYASKVLPSTRFVDNPGLALKLPDRRYAEISLLGLLDVEIGAVNGPGDDIAIFARLAGYKEAKSETEYGIPSDLMSWGYYNGGFWFAVLAMTEDGEWVALGRGTGEVSPETFDLGDLRSIKMLRIMFKPHTNADLPIRHDSIQAEKFSFDIDSIQALH